MKNQLADLLSGGSTWRWMKQNPAVTGAVCVILVGIGLLANVQQPTPAVTAPVVVVPPPESASSPPVPAPPPTEALSRVRASQQEARPTESPAAAFEPLTLKQVFGTMIDYEPPTGSFELLSGPPRAHIRVGTATIDEDFAEVRQAVVEQTAVESALIAFAFTDLDRLKVTSQPLLMSFDSDKTRLLSSPRIEFEITRRELEAYISGTPGIRGASDLRVTRSEMEKTFGEKITPESYAALPLGMKYSVDRARRFVYPDQGSPGRKATLRAFGAR